MVTTINGVVLKKRSIGENDAIVTLLTEELGIIEAAARGVKRPKSKLNGALQPFCYSELTLFHNKDRYSVTKATAIETFYNLRLDVTKVALADYLCELVCFLTPSQEHLLPIKRLLLNSFYLLKEDKKSTRFLKAVNEFRLISMAGFMPDLVCCKECHAYEKSIFYFDLSRGCLLCDACKKDAISAYFCQLTPSVLAALRHIIYSSDDKLFSFTVSENSVCLLSAITEKYALYHTERSFKSLEIYHSLMEEIKE